MMISIIKKMVSITVIVTMTLSLVVGCSKQQPPSIAVNCPQANLDLSKYKDSSDIPTWTGKKLTINYWNAAGIGGLNSYKASSDDVVRKEFERVTGVTIDEQNSIDNNGNSFETRYMNLSATQNWPSVVVSCSNLSDLVKAGKIYDLTTLIPKYCPNLYQYMKKDFTGIWNSVDAGQVGKAYAVPLQLSESDIPTVIPTADKTKYSLSDPTYTYFWMRDDIIKALYPNSLTQDQIEKQYVATGKFTMDQILDLKINNLTDFNNLLKKIKALNIKQNGQEVWPIAAFDGTDNWSLYGKTLASMEGYSYDESPLFTSFNANTKSLVMGAKSSDLKTLVQTAWSWIQDGLSPPDCLVDTNQTYTEKINRGEYAITDADYYAPDNALIKKDSAGEGLQGQGYQYRRVYISAPVKSDSVSRLTPPYCADSMAIMKDKVKPEDIPQILRAIDYMFTQAGQEMVGWGPRSAGLFNETADGKRTFKDKTLEDQMVRNTGTDKVLDLGLAFNKIDDNADYLVASGWLPLAVKSNRGIYGPYYMYSDRLASDCYLAFDPDKIRPRSTLVTATTTVPWYLANDLCPTYKAIWAQKANYTDALMKVLTAKDSADFETKYQAAMKTADDMGLTSNKVLKEINAFYKSDNVGSSIYK